tara:strand:- start:1455 stop:2084 length:630 start_codon:yes stop_codon:yes gene_type:complete
MKERIIQSQKCISEGVSFLASIEPRFEYALKVTGELPLRLSPEGFERLLGAIISQQVSVAAANSIWKRLVKANLNGPRKIMRADDDELRAVGLSRQKVRYARALAEARINFKSLRTKSTAEVVEKLTQVPGIGVWTAEIYAMFSLGRADVFAAGDLALQESGRLLFELNERPTEKEIRRMAENWSPWRAVAARLLWAYYGYIKKREGVR